MEKIKSALEAAQVAGYKEALIELLYQLADDDFILAFRGSEWLGLAPHIEEDVAYSSINQNMMGHAYMYYQLLEELGCGKVDELAHGREAAARRNAILLELANGSGTYLETPKFDWAFTVVRHYFYDVYKKVKLDLLKNSSYVPLADAAVNIIKEQHYHLMHWDLWFRQLIGAGGEAKTRMLAAVKRVCEDFGGVLSYGAGRHVFTSFQLIESEEELKKRFIGKMNGVFQELGLQKLPELKMSMGDGRNKEHTDDLKSALATLSEVYQKDSSAVW